jgi:hypothetical protein
MSSRLAATLFSLVKSGIFSFDAFDFPAEANAIKMQITVINCERHRSTRILIIYNYIVWSGSIFFLLTIYLCRESSKRQLTSLGRLRATLFWNSLRNRSRTAEVSADSNVECAGYACDAVTGSSLPNSSNCSESETSESQGRLHFGSFYLRLGAVAFGIGSMIYSGLEFGQFFELDSKEQCYSFLYGFTPTSHMLFTFFQLYFIFMNSKSLISKHRYLGKFRLFLYF